MPQLPATSFKLITQIKKTAHKKIITCHSYRSFIFPSKAAGVTPKTIYNILVALIAKLIYFYFLFFDIIVKNHVKNYQPII